MNPIGLSGDPVPKISELSRQTGRAETDLVADAVSSSLGATPVPQPAPGGTIADPGLAAVDIDAWLAAEWRLE